MHGRNTVLPTHTRAKRNATPILELVVGKISPLYLSERAYF